MSFSLVTCAGKIYSFFYYELSRRHRSPKRTSKLYNNCCYDVRTRERDNNIPNISRTFSALIKSRMW